MSEAVVPARTAEPIGGDAVEANGIDRALAAFIKAWLYLLSLAPARLTGCLTQTLYLLTVPFARSSMKWLYRNLRQVYGIPPHSSFARTFAKQVLTHQIATVIEATQIVRSPKHFQFEGTEGLRQVLETAQAANKGIIMVTAHMGSWELIGYQVVKILQDRFYVLAKPSKAPALTAVLDHMRTQMGMKVLWTHRKSILRDMLAVLKHGGCLGFVMDQKPTGRVGPVVSFMGQPTAFVSGPAQLAAKTGCPVIGVFCMREGLRRYRMISKMILPPHHAMHDQTAMTQLMASEIERMIRLYPEQWAWNYKRWRFEGMATQQ